MNSHFHGIFIGLFMFLPLSLCAQNLAINTTGATGDSSALLDVNATDKGMLIPRVNLTSTLDTLPFFHPRFLCSSTTHLHWVLFLTILCPVFTTGTERNGFLW